MKTCNCNYAITGKCFVSCDRIWHERNLKLVTKVSKLGWYAFAQEEAARLREKGDWMERLGDDSVNDIICAKLANAPKSE